MIRKAAIDLLVFTSVLLSLVLVLTFAEPYHRGYFPDDQSLMLPYKEPSILKTIILIIGFLLVIITVIITESVRDAQEKGGVNCKCLGKIRLKGWFWMSYMNIGVFLFGLTCQALTVLCAKYTTGRLRPHFFSLCKPIAFDKQIYVQNYTCSVDDFARIKNMRLSFPSGHSSAAMYTAIFYIFYVQINVKRWGSKLLPHGFQFLMFMGAWYVGLTRVSDHMHHATDVAIGFGLGALFAESMFYLVLKSKRIRLLTVPTIDSQKPILSR